MLNLTSNKSIIVVALLCFVIAAQASCPEKCGSKPCCDDSRYGLQCYSDEHYQCTTDNLGATIICAKGMKSCNSKCYSLDFDCTESHGAFRRSSTVSDKIEVVTESSNTDAMWIQAINHEGTAAFNADPAGYKVYRNVKDFGAVGDGITDDTGAINAAITTGARCGKGCDSSTITPALVFFPQGTYLVSSPIIQYYFTQLVGDARNPPTIVASPNFQGIAVIDSNPYDNTGNNWWTNQNNFYRQVRNFIIDLTRMPPSSGTGVHWQVAQATSLTNIVFQMSTQSGNVQQGIFMENGSGGFMSDLIFNGGKLGMWIGNQQFTARNITINNADTAVVVGWNWGWTFKTLNINNCRVGIDMSAGGSDSQAVGSLIVLDATITNTNIGFITTTSETSLPHTSGTLLLDNVNLKNVPTAIVGEEGKVLLSGSSDSSVIQSWGQGQIYNDKSTVGKFTQGHHTIKPTKTSSLLNSQTGAFFERPRPQYENSPVSDFLSVKRNGAKGDGRTDDTQAIQATLNQAANSKIVYFPAGTYLVSSTVVIPAGSRLVGEAWSVLSATGAEFLDEHSPKAVFQVGNVGDEGSVEITDILFSTQGPVPGAILVQWNIRDPAGQPGASGMWDSHFRVGGAAGTNLQTEGCVKLQGGVKPSCQGAFAFLHLTESSSAYLENVWAWTADHDLDGDHSQISIYNARGILVESTNGPVWMYGTASEHNVFYQYSIVNAKNVLLAMIQTETPYYQSVPLAPAPFTTNNNVHDPDFSSCTTVTCAMAWGLHIKASENIYVYGAGLYNFFQNYDQTCLTTEDCQDSMVSIDESTKGLYLYNLNTKASKAMINVNGANVVKQGDNTNGFCSSIAGWFTNA